MQKIINSTTLLYHNNDHRVKRNQNIATNRSTRHERNQEYAMWEQSLDFFLSQIAYMKTRLSAKIDLIDDKNQILTAENLINRFIKEDDRINILQRDIQSLVLSNNETVDQHKEFFAQQTHLPLLDL